MPVSLISWPLVQRFLSGLAPQWFEVDADLLISNKGKTSFELDAEYQLLFTNYLYLVADLEATVALSEDRAIGVGRGLSSTEVGLRLTYDLIGRAVSPYIGVAHERKYGDTKELARASGRSTDTWFAVIGARMFF